MSRIVRTFTRGATKKKFEDLIPHSPVLEELLETEHEPKQNKPKQSPSDSETSERKSYSKVIIEQKPLTEAQIEFNQRFKLEKSRYTFCWWGERAQLPEIFPFNTAFNIKQIAIGGRHFIGLSEQSQVFSWGNGQSGQLGHGEKQILDQPTRVVFFDSIPVSSVYANAAQSAALSCDGKLYIWGWNELETNFSPQLIPKLADKKILQFALGGFHFICLVAGPHGREVYTWGAGARGQLGHGNFENLMEPTLVELLRGAQAQCVVAGETYSAVISMYGNVLIWGSNEDGVLGVNSTARNINTPSMVAGLEGVKIVKIAVGYQSTAAISVNGTLYTWGKNTEGQLGLGTTENYQAIAHRVESLSGVEILGVVCGHNHKVAWSSNGTVYSWGSNRDHRLGLDCDVPFISVPTPIERLQGRAIFDISCGARCVIACIGVKLFDIPLEAIDPGPNLPKIVLDCVSYLKQHASEEGLFRISCTKSEQDQLVQWWDAGYSVTMDNAPSVHVVAGVFGYFLQQLPEPLLTFGLYEKFMATKTEASKKDVLLKLEAFRRAISLLPPKHRDLLEKVLDLLWVIDSKQSTSLMNTQNLANIFAPTFIRAHPSVSLTHNTEYAKDIRSQISITKSLIKYSRAIFSQNSCDMINALEYILVDESASEEKLHKEQEKHFKSWTNLLLEEEFMFVLKDLSLGSMRDVVRHSNLISIAVQSALLYYPLESYQSLFEQLLSLLPDTNVEIATRLIKGLSHVRLPATERQYIANLICAYKLPQKNTEPVVDWKSVSVSDYVVDDPQIKINLEQAERAIFALRHAEQQRKLICVHVPTISSCSSGNLFELIAKYRANMKDQVQALEEQRERRLQGDPLITEKAVAQRAELDRLTAQREKLVQQIADKEAQLASLETPRASLIFDGKIEEIQSELLQNQQALEAHKLTLEKFLHFYQVYFLPNHQRLVQIRADVEKSIYSSALEAPSLINRYLDAALTLLNDIRKRLKRVRKDLKRISKSYGAEAAVPIQAEYGKLKDIFLDLVSELEDAMIIYFPMIAPVQQWLDYCSSNLIDPFNHNIVTTSKVDEYLQSIKASAGQRLALTALLEGFSYPPAGGLHNPITNHTPVTIDGIYVKQTSVDETIAAVKKRHGWE